MGYEGPANPDARGTLLKSVGAVNALPEPPAFIVFTGDLTHTTDDPDERRRRMRPSARASLKALLRWLTSGWRAPVLGFALRLLCALPLARWQGIPGQPAVAEVQADELVASHVRALGGGPLFQVASSDRHTVKPWYQGKLDYSPPVPDLSDQGFPLAGGRVEALHGEATAALAYRRHLHVIDVYVRPSRAPAVAPTLRTERGFHVLAWRDGAMQYWAVSDVEADELQRFALAWQARTAP